MRKPLKLAIIGCGQVSHFMALACRFNAAIKISHCVDPNLAKARRFANIYRVPKFFQSEDELYQDSDLPEAVYIATPHYLHGSQILKGIKQGLAVLCEKPAVTQREEAEKLLKAISESGAKVGINYQFRYDTKCSQLKEAILKGEFGRLSHIKVETYFYRAGDYFSPNSWHGQLAKSGGGVLNGHGSHALNLALWLTDSYPLWAMGNCHKSPFPKSEIESSGWAMLELNHGLCLQIYSTAHYPKAMPLRVEIRGSGGMAKYMGFIRNNLKKSPGNFKQTWAFPSLKNHAFYRSVEAFRGWVQEDCPYRNIFEESLYTYSAMEAIYKSSELGEPQPVQYPIY